LRSLSAGECERYDSVRPQLLLSLIPGLLLAGCATDYHRDTGITCTEAIHIAERHSAHHPAAGETEHGNPFRYVESAGWDGAKGVWEVDLMAAGGNYGRQYRIASNGEVIGYRILDHGSRHYYGPDLSDDEYRGSEGDDGYGNVRNDQTLSPVGEYAR